MKKLLIFLMIAIPLVVILVVNLTVNVVTGIVSVSVDSISLNMTEIEATIDDVITLEATILPKNATNKDVVWKSTNEDVAKVDLNGTITFVGFGNGYITATSVDGSKRASCYFYATDTEVHQIILTSADAQNSNYYVGLNQTLQLSSIILPSEALNKDVVYKSEDESIASVDSNGLVLGKKEGRVKITSISESKPDISDSVIVEVVKPVESISVTSEKAVTSFNTYQISYSVYPSDASVSSVLYVSKDPTVATVSPSGVVTFLKPGIVVVEIISVEGQKKTEIEVEYTAGYATDLILDTESIQKSINEGGMYIQYSTIPQSVDVDVTFSSDDESVAFVDDSGYIQFMGGGNTLIRAKIQKSEDEWIEKVIRLHIESPATGIIIENEFVVATKEFKLSPKSYPLNSTNQIFSYFSNDSSIAVVDENGVVSFVKDDYASVVIDVYANPEKNVKRSVKLTYTKGYPTGLEIENEKLYLNHGEISQINYNLYPEHVLSSVADVKFNIIEENGNNLNKVIEVLSDGSVRALGGGNAKVEVSCLLYSGARLKKYVDVFVTRKVEEIEFVSDLDVYNDEYITCSQKVSFDFRSLTQDASNKKISWQLLNNTAIKSADKEITFNSAGVAQIKLVSDDLNAERIVNIRYLKSNIVEAVLSEIPQTLQVSEELEINAVSTLPKDANVGVSIKISNQITSSELGRVLQLEGKNKIKAVAGGTANIIISVSNLQFTYKITCIKKAEQIVVTPENISITKDRVLLNYEVLPVDTTNKEVVFEVLNDVAEAQGSTIVFKKNGEAKIVAKTLDGSNISYEFTLTKTEKGSGDISFTGEDIIMQVGETNLVALNGVDFEYESKELLITLEDPVFEGNKVVELEGDLVKAVGLGRAVLSCILTNKAGVEKTISIEIKVIQISEDIEFISDLDVVLGEYVTANEKVNLNFNILPSSTTNKNYDIRVSRFSSSVEGAVNPYILENRLIFSSVGVAVIQVATQDEGTMKQFKIRYTGGNAVDAELNVGEEVVLNIGEEINLDVLRWIPKDTTNTQIYIREISHSQGVLKVIEVEDKKIRAVAGGESRLLVELSDGITKSVKVVVSRKVEQININDEVLTKDNEIILNPVVIPSNATNKVLLYSLAENSIAYLDGKKVVFTKPGTVYVTIKTTDGSDISKEVKIISTFGYVDNFELSSYSKDLRKDGQFTLFVKEFYPNDAENREFNFEVVQNTPNDESAKNVVEISQNGEIKALLGGSAVVRVYTTDYYGNKIYKDCQINVYAQVTGFNVVFNRKLDEETQGSGSFVTAQPNIEFKFEVQTSDATNKNILASSSNESVALISENKINFLKKGMVDITFTSQDNTKLSKTYSFYYTEGKILSLSIDERDFVDNILTLEVGETFTFKEKTYSPSDATNISFSITDKNESRVDSQKTVMMFDQGTITALNGGEVSFDLLANSVKVGRYTLRVVRKCDDIEVNSEEVYLNTTDYQIVAKALPSDTTENLLCYRVISGNGSVDENGYVVISGDGVVEVKVYSQANENIFKVIRIEYSNQVKKIRFNQTVSQLYMGTRVDLTVVGEPFNVEEFKVRYSSSNPEIATVNEYGRVFANSTAGDVTIRAEVVGKEDIFTERTFTVIPILSNINLELDNVNDKLGIAEYRVWGNVFVNWVFNKETNKNTLSLVDTYQMKINSVTINSEKLENTSLIKFIWKSSNTDIATVDENGLVKFIGTGLVTISVEPEDQYNPNLPVRDSYTFNIISGVNIFTYEDFAGLYDANITKPTILHTDLMLTKGYVLSTAIHGNGHMMNFSGSTSYDRISIKNSNVLIDNVTIRGINFDKVAALSTLADSCKPIMINPDNSVGKIRNIVIKNSIIENGMIGIEVINADVSILGCIIRNTFSAGLVITRNKEVLAPPEVFVKDCIFAKSLFGSILFNVEQNPTNLNYPSKLIVENIEMYNWIDVDEFRCDFIENWVKNSAEQIVENLNNYPAYRYTYNGKDYFMMGIVQVELKGKFLGAEVITFKSVGVVEFRGENPYTHPIDPPITGSVTNFKYAGSTAAGIFEIDVYTLKGDTKYITPASTYEDDINLNSRIQQPFN